MTHPPTTPPAVPDIAVNDDVFEYTNSGGMTQCISGFGENAIEAVSHDLRGDPADDEYKEALGRLEWHVRELVRWCRNFNGENQRMKAALAALRKRAGDAEGERDRLRKSLEGITAIESGQSREYDFGDTDDCWRCDEMKEIALAALAGGAK
jgi:galactokinase